MSWDQDLALVSSDDGEDFVAWFDRTTLTEDECWRFVDSVPLSRIYEIADEARRRSEVWVAVREVLGHALEQAEVGRSANGAGCSAIRRTSDGSGVTPVAER